MNDGPRTPKGPPPRRPHPSSPELQRVTESDNPTDTEEVDVFIPPPPRAVREPFKLLAGERKPARVWTNSELGAAISSLQTALGHIGASITETLAVQRKMARQTDGLTTSMNGRFDVFHEELALLRATVTGDHETRLVAVEQVTASQRAVRAIGTGSKYTVGGGVSLILLKVAATQWPWLASILHAVGL